MCWLLLTVADCQKELSLDNILVLTIESMWAVRHLTREESVKMDSGLKPLKHLGAQSSHVFSFFFNPLSTVSYLPLPISVFTSLIRLAEEGIF